MEKVIHCASLYTLNILWCFVGWTEAPIVVETLHHLLKPVEVLKKMSYAMQE